MMNHLKMMFEYHKERLAAIAEYMNANPNYHHIVLMPSACRFRLHEALASMTTVERRVPASDETSVAAPAAQRIALLQDMEDWLNRPEETGYAMIDARFSYHGWRVGGDANTRIRMSWVAGFPYRDFNRDACIVQALARFRLMDNGSPVRDVQVGLASSETPSQWLHRKRGTDANQG